jgi:hypothetical protein
MPILLVFALTSALVPAGSQADPREQLSTAVAHGIKLLEARDHARFLREFVSPDDAKQIFGQEPGGPDNPRLAEQFGKQKAPQLLEALREAQRASPQYENNGQLAAFPLKTPIGSRRALAFVKVGKYWYIKN